MKITKEYLKRVIKEELNRVVSEQEQKYSGPSYSTVAAVFSEGFVQGYANDEKFRYAVDNLSTGRVNSELFVDGGFRSPTFKKVKELYEFLGGTVQNNQFGPHDKQMENKLVRLVKAFQVGSDMLKDKRPADVIVPSMALAYEHNTVGVKRG